MFQVELVHDNLFEWHVRLHKIDPESDLAADLREFNISNILLHLIFPENFPFAPPFMRVIEPRIEKGFVMEGQLHRLSCIIVQYNLDIELKLFLSCYQVLKRERIFYRLDYYT